MDHDIKTEAHQFLVGEMIAACALHFQTLDKPWRSMRQSDQQDLLADIRADIEKAARSAVEIIAGDGRYVYRAHCKKVNFGEDGVQATIELANTPEAHDLADRAGSTVLVINEDGRRYMGGHDVVKAEPDSKPLFDANEPSPPKGSKKAKKDGAPADKFEGSEWPYPNGAQ